MWEKIFIERTHGDCRSSILNGNLAFFASNVWKGADFTMHFDKPQAKKHIKWSTLYISSQCYDWIYLVDGCRGGKQIQGPKHLIIGNDILIQNTISQSTNVDIFV